MILQKLKADAEGLSRRAGRPRRSSPCPPTSTTPNVRPPRTPAASPAWTVKRIINEPTAAALAYGLDKKDGEKIAVYDLGGGTFDISILEVGDGVFEVKATNGDTTWAATISTRRLIDYLIEEFKKDQGIDCPSDRWPCSGSRRPPRRPRSSSPRPQQTEINLPYITADQTGPKHLTMKLTRAKFEQLVEDLVERNHVAALSSGPQGRRLSRGRRHRRGHPGRRLRPACPSSSRRVQSCSARSRTRAVNPDEVVAWGRRCRPACWPETSRTCCCST